jgi:hypothetical protein
VTRQEIEFLFGMLDGRTGGLESRAGALEARTGALEARMASMEQWKADLMRRLFVEPFKAALEALALHPGDELFLVENAADIPELATTNRAVLFLPPLLEEVLYIIRPLKLRVTLVGNTPSTSPWTSAPSTYPSGSWPASPASSGGGAPRPRHSRHEAPNDARHRARALTPTQGDRIMTETTKLTREETKRTKKYLKLIIEIARHRAEGFGTFGDPVAPSPKFTAAEIVRKTRKLWTGNEWVVRPVALPEVIAKLETETRYLAAVVKILKAREA